MLFRFDSSFDQVTHRGYLRLRSSLVLGSTTPPAMAEQKAKAVPDDENSPDYFYICKRALLEVREKIKKGEEITKDNVEELTSPENLKDDEIMVPVDMRGVGEEFDDVEQMVGELGPKGTAEALVKAADYFEAHKGQLQEDECPKEMTAKDWRAVLAEEEGDDEEGEEEYYTEGDELEEPEEEDDDDEDPTPAAKKAKKS